MKKGCIIACVVFLVLAILAGIGIFVAGYFVVKSPTFQNEFNSSFKESFKKTFVESCSKDDVETMEPICTCMADHLLENNTPAELTKLSLKDQKEIENSDILQSAAQACTAETGAPTR